MPKLISSVTARLHNCPAKSDKPHGIAGFTEEKAPPYGASFW